MTLAITWLVDSDKKLGHMSFLIVLSGLLIASVALFNSVNGIGMVEGTRVTIGRDLGSMLGDPNDLSLVLMFPLAFSIGMASTKGIKTPTRILSLLVSVALMAAVIATQSRGGLLGSLAVFGIFAIKMIRSKALLICLGLLAATILFAAAGISDRASGGAAEEGIDASAMGRLYAWEAAIGMAVDNPLTGVGLNNFYANYYFYSSHWDGLNHAVHSTWFGVLAETGILGLIIFVCFIGSLIRTSRATLKALSSDKNYSPYLIASANSVYAGLMGIIVSGPFLLKLQLPIYILAALTVAVAKLEQIHCQNENQ